MEFGFILGRGLLILFIISVIYVSIKALKTKQNKCKLLEKIQRKLVREEGLEPSKSLDTRCLTRNLGS